MSSAARLQRANRLCRQNGHPMPTNPLWDRVTSGVCIQCGETWTREPVVRTANDLLLDYLRATAARLVFWGWFGMDCERRAYLEARERIQLTLERTA